MSLILAKTIYGEARGEVKRFGAIALAAVAHVILNRVKGAAWYGKTIDEVCTKKWQFSCWNASDPNAALLHDDAALEKDPVFQLCQDIAVQCIRGDVSSPVGDANHYHTTAVSPLWSRGKTPNITIGHHHFYTL